MKQPPRRAAISLSMFNHNEAAAAAPVFWYRDELGETITASGYRFPLTREAQARRGRYSGSIRGERANQRARRVRFYHRNGWAVDRIAARFGISRRTVYLDLKRPSDQPPWTPDTPLPFPNTRRGALLCQEPLLIAAHRKKVLMKELTLNRETVKDYARVSLDQAKTAALEWDLEVTRRFASALEAAWECGRYLRIVKQSLPHGEFGRWLDADFAQSKRTAQDRMRFAAEYSREDLAELGTIRQARAALPKRKPEKVAEAPREAQEPEPAIARMEDSPVESGDVSSREVEKMLEREALVEQAREAEADNQRLERELAEEKQVVAHSEGRDVIRDLHAEIRELKGRLEESEVENRQLRAENWRLRLALKRTKRDLQEERERHPVGRNGWEPEGWEPPEEEPPPEEWEELAL